MSVFFKNECTISMLKTLGSLKTMLDQMYLKHLDLGRITKVASSLIAAGVTPNSISQKICERCLNEQNTDGGWIAVPDTIWNVYFLKSLQSEFTHNAINQGLAYLSDQKNSDGLWGRSKRDVSRIPVTGLLAFLLPELADSGVLHALESLWDSEKNSLTYKAGYSLMAFSKNNYSTTIPSIVQDTIKWLIANQHEDGGFSPWLSHPVNSNVYCTSIATIGLLGYKHLVPTHNLEKAQTWLINNQLPTGIWKYHEIEDGASWGLYALNYLRAGF